MENKSELKRLEEKKIRRSKIYILLIRFHGGREKENLVVAILKGIITG